MKKIVDMEELKKAYQDSTRYVGGFRLYDAGFFDAMEFIDYWLEAQPDAEEKRGKWEIKCHTSEDVFTGEIDEIYYFKCSECKREVYDVDEDLILEGKYTEAKKEFPYCHCGAKMDLGEEENG